MLEYLIFSQQKFCKVQPMKYYAVKYGYTEKNKILNL